MVSMQTLTDPIPSRVEEAGATDRDTGNSCPTHQHLLTDNHQINPGVAASAPFNSKAGNSHHTRIRLIRILASRTAQCRRMLNLTQASQGNCQCNHPTWLNHTMVI